MKQKTKKIITIAGTVLLGLSLVGNVILGIDLATKESSKDLSGSINESWHYDDTYIGYQTCSNEIYYTSAYDYITKINFAGESDGSIKISYETHFSLSDDLDTFFYLSNANNEHVYTTETERTHSPYGGDYIKIPASTVSAYNLTACHISRVWVRTID